MTWRTPPLVSVIVFHVAHGDARLFDSYTGVIATNCSCSSRPRILPPGSFVKAKRRLAIWQYCVVRQNPFGFSKGIGNIYYVHLWPRFACKRSAVWGPALMNRTAATTVRPERRGRSSFPSIFRMASTGTDTNSLHRPAGSPTDGIPLWFQII